MGKVTEHQTSVTADVVTRTTKGRWSDVGVGAGRRADGLTEDDENEADRPNERTNEGRQSALRAAPYGRAALRAGRPTGGLC